MTFIPIGPFDDLPEICIEIDVTNNPTDPTRVWTDITELGRQISSTRSGRNDELNRTSTGIFNVLLDNRDDALTSLGIRKSQWIRYRARWAGIVYARWQGLIEDAPRQWPSSGFDDIYQIRAADALKVFNIYDLAGETFPGQRNDERIVDLIDLAGLAAGDIDTDTDDADAIVDPITEGTTALSTALGIEASENGLLIAEPDGSISFQGRHWRPLNSRASVGTFGEDGDAGQIPYRSSVVYDDDDSRIANIVAVTPAGGDPVVVEDSDSQDKYFKRRLAMNLLTSSSSLARDAAYYLLGLYKDPSPRIPSISVPLAAAALIDPDLVATLLATGNSTRYTWSRDATTPIMTDVYVEQVGETITFGQGWEMQFQLSPASDVDVWVAEDPVLGLAGITTRGGY